MSKVKYDGWVLKSYMGKNPWLVPNYFRATRTEVKKRCIKFMGEKMYRKRIREGALKVVKVRIIEVNDGQ